MVCGAGGAEVLPRVPTAQRPSTMERGSGESVKHCRHQWMDRTDVLSKVFTIEQGTRVYLCTCGAILEEKEEKPKAITS